MTQKSTGLNKHSFSSAGELKQRNFVRPSSYDLQIKKQNKAGKISKAPYSLKGSRHFFGLKAQGGGDGNSYKEGGGFNPKVSKETELNRRYFIVGERRISSYWWASVFFFGGFGFLITGISSYIKYNLFTSVYRNIEAFINNGPDLFKTGEASLTAPFLIDETGGESLVFFPQGLLLCFYGSLGLLLSLYWWLLIYWNVGGGFNEFNKKEGFMRIFRWGYPGKNRRIDIVYPLKDIEAIRVELNQTPGSGLLASEQTIFIRLLSTPSAINNEQTFSNNIKEIGVANSEKLGEKRASLSPSSVINRVGGIEKLKEKREIPLGGIGQPLTLKEIEKQASELANYLQVALEGL